jgi:hypothetical protein
MLIYEWLGCFAGAQPGRQKGLVDHVCPAVFSYLKANGKVPLTIITLALPLMRARVRWRHLYRVMA